MRAQNSRRALSPLLAAAMLLSGVPRPLPAQVAAPADSARAPAATAAGDPAAAADPLEQARELLRDGEYDRSIDVLKAALARTTGDTERRRETYLLLIKTYVFLGNDLKFRPQGREASNLNYQEARRLIAECLAVRDLRHTRPEPASQYPPEMVAFFAEARRAMFGAFLVREIAPAAAVVLLDGDTLRARPGEARAGDVDIPAGPHVVVVRAPGHRETTDRITIAPGVTLERSYRLVKRRSGLWYATRGAGALGLVGGAIALIAGGRGGANTASPLPGAPDPPAGP